MDLDVNEVGYFITQVGLSAASFGVAAEDVTAVGTSLNKAFGYKCAPPAMILPNTTAELQAICIADNCPTSPNATCAAYSAVEKPTNATKSATSSGASATAKSTAPANSVAAASLDYKSSGPIVAVVAGVAAFAFAL